MHEAHGGGVPLTGCNDQHGALASALVQTPHMHVQLAQLCCQGLCMHNIVTAILCV